MAYGFKIMVEGDYACFTRPELKVERVSYDVPPPGRTGRNAEKLLLEAVYKCIRLIKLSCSIRLIS